MQFYNVENRSSNNFSINNCDRNSAIEGKFILYLPNKKSIAHATAKTRLIILHIKVADLAESRTSTIHRITFHHVCKKFQTFDAARSATQNTSRGSFCLYKFVDPRLKNYLAQSIHLYQYLYITPLTLSSLRRRQTTSSYFNFGSARDRTTDSLSCARYTATI